MLDLYIDTDDRTARYTCSAIRQHQDSRPKRSLRYPDNNTLLSDRSKYGIIPAETVRFQRNTMHWRDYAGLCGDMLHDMEVRAYSYGKVTRRARKAAKAAATYYGHSQGRHILRLATRIKRQRFRETEKHRQRPRRARIWAQRKRM